MQEKAMVVAFHCSGANASQWCPLTHGETVSGLIAEHVRDSSTESAAVKLEKSSWWRVGGPSSQGWRMAS